VLLTSLYNHTQPLIRYELTDRFTRHPAAAGQAWLRATVEGRPVNAGSADMNGHPVAEVIAWSCGELSDLSG
jgi:hypothetical protein